MSGSWLWLRATKQRNSERVIEYVAMNRGRKFMIAADRGISIRSRDDITDAVGASLGRGSILLENDLGSDFFDLRTGLAGELIQKFGNDRTRVVIVVAVPIVTVRDSPNWHTSTPRIQLSALFAHSRTR